MKLKSISFIILLLPFCSLHCIYPRAAAVLIRVWEGKVDPTELLYFPCKPDEGCGLAITGLSAFECGSLYNLTDSSRNTCCAVKNKGVSHCLPAAVQEEREELNLSGGSEVEGL